ncbi:GNAT family N-acetyltransferase [Paenibacillus sp. SAF-054]|uniref:GNAT family N-acetyltransferase n=1 Tax=unclassified Paenibacillus TaxID=185978 RepID=UPI003F7E5E3C
MIQIKKCTFDDYEIVDNLFRRLINEIIIKTTGDQSLFSLTDTRKAFNQGMEQGIYSVFMAISGGQTIGFIAMCESFSLYADGRFGIIQELYVLENYRSMNVGGELLKFAINYGQEKGWKRLEVCTPPIPEFERTLEFYEKNEFSITGGKKLKIMVSE